MDWSIVLGWYLIIAVATSLTYYIQIIYPTDKALAELGDTLTTTEKILTGAAHILAFIVFAPIAALILLSIDNNDMINTLIKSRIEKLNKKDKDDE